MANNQIQNNTKFSLVSEMEINKLFNLKLIEKDSKEIHHYLKLTTKLKVYSDEIIQV